MSHLVINISALDFNQEIQDYRIKGLACDYSTRQKQGQVTDISDL